MEELKYNLARNIIFLLQGELIVGGRMKVVDLKVKDNNGNIVSKGELKLDKFDGILEEKASRDENKQVSILSEDVRSLIDTGKIDGLCTRRFYENITVSGLDSSKLSVGSKIGIGETIQEVTGLGKRCFNECKLVEEGKYCQLSEGAIFTRVLKGGCIGKNNKVNII